MTIAMEKGRVKFDAAPHSKLSLKLWLRLLNCTTVIEKKIRTYLAKEYNMTLPRFDVLAALDRYPDGLTMSELSEHLYVTNGNVTGLVARLVDDGLVERQTSAQDRRTARIKLTKRGKRSFAKMAVSHEEYVDDLLGGLSDDEIAKLIVALDDVRAGLEDRIAASD